MNDFCIYVLQIQLFKIKKKHQFTYILRKNHARFKKMISQLLKRNARLSFDKVIS